MRPTGEANVKIAPLGRTAVGFDKKLLYAPESSIAFVEAAPQFPSLAVLSASLGTVGEVAATTAPAAVSIRGQACGSGHAARFGLSAFEIMKEERGLLGCGLCKNRVRAGDDSIEVLVKNCEVASGTRRAHPA